MSVVRSDQLEFLVLPGRASADPFAGFGVDDLAVRVVVIEDTPIRNLHRHPLSPEVVYVARGHGRAWQSRSSTVIGPGDLIFVPAGVPHATLADRGSRLQLICFFPHGDLADNLVELEETVSIGEG